MLADAGLEISAGKMSSWWAGRPPTLRLEELDVLCAVLDCTPNDLMTPEPDKVRGRRPSDAEAVNGDGEGGRDHDDKTSGEVSGPPTVAPRRGTPRSRPPV